MATISDLTVTELGDLLKSKGLQFSVGPYTFRYQTPVRKICQAIHVLYGQHPVFPSSGFVDFRLRFDPGRERGKRVIFSSVNGKIWNTWPLRLAVGSVEWVTSWCFFRASHGYLAIHGAAAEIPNYPGHAISCPGLSGAGKSTLAATLMMSGWSLLSDEISLIDKDHLSLHALARPVILKGNSLRLIADRFGDHAVFGPAGRILDPPATVAHLRPTKQTVKIAGQQFVPTAFVFPQRAPTTRAELKVIDRKDLFQRLQALGLNYRMLGERGFEIACRLAGHVPAFELHYEHATDAEQLLRNHDWASGQREFVASIWAAPGKRIAEPVASGAEPCSEPERADSSTACLESEQWHATEAAWQMLGPKDTKTLSAIRAPVTASETAARRCENDAVDHDLHGGTAYRSVIDCLVDALEKPQSAVQWSITQWDQCYNIAEHTELISRLADAWMQAGWIDQFPLAVQRRIQYECVANRFNAVEFGNEAAQLEQIFQGFPGEVLLLKGAAFSRTAMGWARGRRTRDVDLLVAESQVDRANQRLQNSGYKVANDYSAKDCAYYRRWLHELPPQKHFYRKIEVDLHFRLLPFCDPCSFPAEPLIERSVKIPNSVFSILDPTDLAIHTSINLSRTGELRRVFRDLWDLRCQIENPYWGSKSVRSARAFDWDEFAVRTTELGLQRSVGAVIKLARDFVRLAVPDGWIENLLTRRQADLHQRWLERMMRCAALPEGPSLRTRRRRFALWAMEHYPMPKLRTWFDPLTWTKRVTFMKEG